MGRAIAEAMGHHGATVIVSSDDADGCAAVVDEFKKQGIRAVSVSCDMSQKSAIDALYQSAMAQLGRVDILVSCVGIAPVGSFGDITATDFEQTMALNLQSAIYLTKLVLPQMQERRDGCCSIWPVLPGFGATNTLGYMACRKRP